jgi:general secretion pathway protein G
MAHTSTNNRAGFSIAELMIVIAIIGILSAIMVPSYFGFVNRARRRNAESTLRILKQAITMFELDNSHLPETLKDLVKKPANATNWQEYLERKEIPMDPWGEKYQYKKTPGGEHPYELYSFGSSGRGAPKTDWINAWKL